jgi:CRP/FNR family cyclic AMP-dependent transcriptional regulator
MTAYNKAATDNQPEYLSRFLSYCHTKKYPAKSDIIRPGDPADVLSFILQGSVSVMMEDEDGHELILTYLNKGDFIGEMGIFIQSANRSAMIRTRTPCLIAEISYTKLEHLLATDLQEFAIDIIHAMGTQLAERLVETSRKVSHLAFYDVAGRIARTLLDLCKQPDAITHPDGMQIKITRQDLGRIVGCSREMVGRILKKLESDGLISVSGKTIVVFGTR